MDSYGESEVSAGARERVGRMMNGESLTLGSIVEVAGLWGGDSCQK